MNLKKAYRLGIVTRELEDMWWNQNNKRFKRNPSKSYICADRLLGLSMFFLGIGIIFMCLWETFPSRETSILFVFGLISLYTSVFLFHSTKNQATRSDLAFIKDCTQLVKNLGVNALNITDCIIYIYCYIENAAIEKATEVVGFEIEYPQWHKDEGGKLEHKNLREGVVQILQISGRFVTIPSWSKKSIYKAARAKFKELEVA